MVGKTISRYKIQENIGLGEAYHPYRLKVERNNMEKKRWSLIFIGLCLALVFSVSSVEAQRSCDGDGDGFVKDTSKCRKLLEEPGILGIDLNDRDCAVPDVNGCDNGGGGGSDDRVP